MIDKQEKAASIQAAEKDIIPTSQRIKVRCYQIIYYLSRGLLLSGRYFFRHWQASIITLSIGIPCLMAAWVFFSLELKVNPDSQAMSLYFSVNNKLLRFERLAHLAQLKLDDKRYLQTLANAAAEAHSIDPKLFRALVTQESAWQPNIVSAKGAAGLTQLMPKTAASECGLQPKERFDPSKNLNCGAQYFAQQLRRFGAVDLALAAYNSGPSRVAKLGRIPRIPETQRYVTRILANWNRGAS